MRDNHMHSELTLKELIALQTQADKMRLNLTRLVTRKALTNEQASIADCRLENFREDLDILISDVEGNENR